ncbi:MAG: imidazole glycerol phosphate synthase subunit HisH [Clostridia bacterium]|nr:imidazole glycerol phosphate synthase subunit HisH [Clostridia bacterium]
MNVILDYGLGNIKSLENWFKRGNEELIISNDLAVLNEAECIILPGVGAFEDAIKMLEKENFDQVLIRHVKKGKPLIGICLGMQLLFDASYEKGYFKGLGILKGDIVPFQGDFKIPHMGWNDLKGDAFYDGKDVYFVHSYYLSNAEDCVVATVDYHVSVPAIVRKDNVMGFQFHPEKSGSFGALILEKIKEFKNEILSSN